VRDRNPTNSSIVFAGTFGNGVYKSTDGGASWSTSYSALVSLSAVTCAGGKKVVVVGDQGTMLSAPVQ